jgi:hypothetical protein
LQWDDRYPKAKTLCEDMKDYSVLKSSREALLRKAGFQEGHNIFNSGSLNQILEFQVEDDGNDTGSPGDQN